MLQKIHSGVTRREKDNHVSYLFFADKRYLFLPLLALNLLLYSFILVIVLYFHRLLLPGVVIIILSAAASTAYLLADRSYEIHFSPHLLKLPSTTVEINTLRQLSFRKVKLSAFQQYFALLAQAGGIACYITLQTEFSEIAIPLKLDQATAENFTSLLLRIAWTSESRLIPLVSDLKKAAGDER